MVPGRFDVPTTMTPLSVVITSPAAVSSQLPPTSAFMSTTTAPDLNSFTALEGTVIGAGRPKIRAVWSQQCQHRRLYHTLYR